MTIRFSRLGSTLQIGATTLAVTAGLWFGSTTYAQTNRSQITPPAPSLGQFLNETNHPRPTWETQRSTNPVAAMRTERLDLSGISEQAAQRLLQTGVVPSQAITERRRAVVTENIPNITQATAEAITRPTTSTNPRVATAAYHSTAARPTGIHQLKSISVSQFEQKIVSIFGDRLNVSASGDGRIVRVAIQGTSDHGSESLAMLVDRETGKLRHEGPSDSAAQWHQLMLKLDSSTPTAKPLPVQQVAYQQQAPLAAPVQLPLQATPQPFKSLSKTNY